MARKESRTGRWRRWADRYFPVRREHNEDTISVRTLEMMDAAVRNLRQGRGGKPIDPALLDVS